MSVHTHTKGRVGEREVIALLQPILDMYAGPNAPKLERNLDQCKKGGADISGLTWLSIEVKRVESLSPDKAWEQCLSQCGANQIPVLFYRMNRTKWRVRLWGSVASPTPRELVPVFPVEISLEDFRHWFSWEVHLRQKRGTL